MGKRFISMIAGAMCLASLVMGCSSVPRLVPSEIPRLNTQTKGLAGPFNNITVTLVNAQADDSDYPVKAWPRGNTIFLLSRKAWTEKLVGALGAELMVRQGKVVVGGPVTISLKITEVTFPKQFAVNKIFLEATASVTSTSGWTKTYVGTGDAVYIAGSGWNRAAQWMITDLVRVIMSDPEFTTELRR